MVEAENLLLLNLFDLKEQENQNTLKLPLIGKIHFVRDQDGQLLSSLVLAYWVYGTFSVLFIVLIPQYQEGVVPAAVLVGFLAVAGLCLMSFIRASLTNPGPVPRYLAAEGAESNWNRCHTCGNMRPPRAHHCRRCGQCVLKMDHHCPWINNCVGEDNHFAFMQLLLYAFLLSLFAFILVMCHFWVFPKCLSCNKEAFYIKHGLWFMYLEFLLSLNMTFMMFAQLVQQHDNVLVNKTTLEKLAARSQLENLQLHQCGQAYREVCGRGLVLFWLCPFGRRRPLQPLTFQYPV